MARNNRVLVPEAREGLNRFKMEAANEVGVNLKQATRRLDCPRGWLYRRSDG